MKAYIKTCKGLATATTSTVCGQGDSGGQMAWTAPMLLASRAAA